MLLRIGIIRFNARERLNLYRNTFVNRVKKGEDDSPLLPLSV